MHTLCGIPEVTLLGTPGDWQSIRRRARALEEYELGWWTEGLGPVLDQLVATSEGRVIKGNEQGSLQRNTMVTEWVSELGQRFGGGPNEAHIPSGISCVPFQWVFPGKTYPMELFGGFVGIAQDPSTLALRPVLGWAVRDAAVAELS